MSEWVACCMLAFLHVHADRCSLLTDASPSKRAPPTLHPEPTPPCPPLAAVLALEASGLAVGITGAGILGGCNPVASGYRAFWDVAANGSWLSVLPGKLSCVQPWQGSNRVEHTHLPTARTHPCCILATA